MKLKKIISNTPDKYILINFKTAINNYNIYLYYCKDSIYKNFSQWLKTEI